jgi:signal transduction histidine kinase
VTLKAVALSIAAVSVIAGFLLVAGAFPTSNPALGPATYSISAVGAGAVLIFGALRLQGRARLAWSLIGLGVLCWGVGETVWNLEAMATGEIPYPGPADFFYVAGYPLIFAGVVLLPYLRPGRFERLRLAIDAAAGSLSLAVVMWVSYLSRVTDFDATQAPLESLLNLFYPFGDVFLATALMILAMRRSEQRLDARVIVLAVAVAFTTVADVIFALQSAANTYIEWQWLDGLWLFSYGAFALGGWAISRPTEKTDRTYRSHRWHLLAPYSAVAALFAIRLASSSGESLLLNLSTTAVAGLVVLRQGIVIRERRELLDRQRDDLVASVSHELRTPLTGIQGYARLLTESWDAFSEQDRRQMMATVADEGDHLGRIVTDLIDVARDRLQNVELQKSPIATADLAREAIAATASGRQIDIAQDENIVVLADLDRVRQVLANLLTNAIRYGRSRILVTIKSRDGMAWFSVHDDGPGVPAKHQHEIWERFERGAHKFDATVPGSGIGLSVARDLVAAHGGAIGYRSSDLLGGACFEFSIPLYAPAPIEELAAS